MTAQDKSRSRGGDSNASWGTFLGLGLEMAVGVGVGYAIGAWLDRRYGWSPAGVLVGSMLGLAGGMYLLIKTALRLNADPPPKKTAGTTSTTTTYETPSTGPEDRR